jgi:hypothetical protein
MATPMQDVEEIKPYEEGIEEGLIPGHEREMEGFDESEDEDDELEFETVGRDDQGRSLRRRRKKSVKGRAWIVLATLATVTARRLFRGSFRK